MASFVDIANMALAHIGSEAVVASLSPTDGSVESGHCARFLPIARQSTLSMHDWGFARKRVKLAEVLNDSDEWLYKYQMPSDCLRARKVLSLANLGYPERGSANYDCEGDGLFTNMAEATLIYTRDITDPTKLPPDVVTGLAMVLAGYLAGPIIKGVESIKIGDAWMERGMAALRQAMVKDANEAQETADALSSAGANSALERDPYLSGSSGSSPLVNEILANVANAVWNKVLP